LTVIVTKMPLSIIIESKKEFVKKKHETAQKEIQELEDKLLSR